jgi:hypothetical protein
MYPSLRVYPGAVPQSYYLCYGIPSYSVSSLSRAVICCWPSPQTMEPDIGRSVGKLMLALASTVSLGFGSYRDPWPNFCSFQDFTCFQMGPAPRREEGLTIIGYSPLLGVTLGFGPVHRSSKFLSALASSVILGSESRGTFSLVIIFHRTDCAENTSINCIGL